MTDSALEQKAVEILTNIEKLAEPAMELTLQSVRYGAVIDLVLSAAFLAMVSFAWVRLTPLAIKLVEEHRDAELPAAILGLIAGIGSAALSVSALFSLFSTTNWLALFSPEMALARMLVEKVS